MVMVFDEIMVMIFMIFCGNGMLWYHYHHRTDISILWHVLIVYFSTRLLVIKQSILHLMAEKFGTYDICSPKLAKLNEKNRKY